MLVNAALDVAPHPAFRQIVTEVLVGIEGIFAAVHQGRQADGTIARSPPAETLSQNLLVLMGICVLARVRPERALLEGVAAPALALLRVDWS